MKIRWILWRCWEIENAIKRNIILGIAYLLALIVFIALFVVGKKAVRLRTLFSGLVVFIRFWRICGARRQMTLRCRKTGTSAETRPLAKDTSCEWNGTITQINGTNTNVLESSDNNDWWHASGIPFKRRL